MTNNSLSKRIYMYAFLRVLIIIVGEWIVRITGMLEALVRAIVCLNIGMKMNASFEMIKYLEVYMGVHQAFALSLLTFSIVIMMLLGDKFWHFVK